MQYEETHDARAGAGRRMPLWRAAAGDAVEAIGTAAEKVARAQYSEAEAEALLRDALTHVRAAASSLRIALVDARDRDQQTPVSRGGGRS